SCGHRLGICASSRLGHQPSCDCGNAHSDDEELEDRGIAVIWFDVVNSHEQRCGNDANAEDENDSPSNFLASHPLGSFTNDSVGSNKGPLRYSLHRKQLLDCCCKRAAARRSLCRPCRRSRELVGLTCSGQDMAPHDTGGSAWPMQSHRKMQSMASTEAQGRLQFLQLLSAITHRNPGPPFDHLVSSHQQCVWKRHTHRLSGLEVDPQVELARLLDGNVGDFCPAQECGGLPRHALSPELDDVWAVADQPTLLGHFRELVHG